MSAALLPIDAVLDALATALESGPSAVLVAPPGAGKTTRVPLHLLTSSWRGDGRLIVLEPRRLAARAAAARMAQTLGEAVGQTVGYRVRLDSRVGPATRIEVVTEGVFTRMVLDDPGLDGVAGVIFDEFHERSLDADLGLALALDVQRVLRPELRLLVMSATLDGARVSRLLGEAPIIESEGRAFPVETRHLGRDPRRRLDEAVAIGVRQALAEQTGSILAFLPGQGEIRRTAERLLERGLPLDVDVAPLYGALTPAEQDRAIAAPPPGRRKVVLATSIAETSLTIEGVRVVVDGGFSRVPRYAAASGLTRLETVRVTRAAADQRRGRAGRTGPGVCYRLWDEAETRGLTPFGRPEILDSDLSGLALDLAGWGAGAGETLAFLDPPPTGAMAEARSLLRSIGALAEDGTVTSHGRRLARLPLPPRLAHMVLIGGARGQGVTAARIAAVLTEPGLGGRAPALDDRLRAFVADRTPRADEARKLASRWAVSAGGGETADDATGLLLAEAFPERIARARGRPGEYRLASGRGVHLDPTEVLAREPWLAVAELGAGEAKDRILLAAPLDEAALRAAFADRTTTQDRLRPGPGGRLEAVRQTLLGTHVLDEERLEADPGLVRAALLDEVRRKGLGVLRWGAGSTALRARVGFLRALDPAWPDLSDVALLNGLEDWLGPLLDDTPALDRLDDDRLRAALEHRLSWDRRAALAKAAPTHFEAPTGTRLPIDYGAEGGPRIEVRVQELFGMTAHPTAAGVPLTLALLSPAGRPVQVTRDLPGFWTGSWNAVRAEMRGRYPRHPWPEDPTRAPPTTRAKPRGT